MHGQGEAYKTHGGTPHLDGAYTVFGKVISGLSVIDSIANVATVPGDKPVEDIYMQVSIEEMSRKQITKQFGYVYPAEEEDKQAL